MGIANHRTDIVKIEALEKHPNADSLSIVRVGGYQVVVRTENWKVGDLAIYIQPDSVVPATLPFQFLWANMTFPGGHVPQNRRRVTARRFRGEWSEGLLLPLRDFPAVHGRSDLNIGDDVSEDLGIYHYEPPEDSQQTSGDNESAPGTKQKRRFPRTFWGWIRFIQSLFKNTGGVNTSSPNNFRPIYDVEAFKNYMNVLLDGEQVRITEKIHGSNARYTFSDGKMYAGSRKLWKAPVSSCIWRRVLAQHVWIENWCRAHEGYTLYGEVVPTQGDKYNYGCQPGETKFFVFDILSPKGEWINPDKDDIDVNAHWVPILYEGPFSSETMFSLLEGNSTIHGAKHIREGIVIRPVIEREVKNLGRVQLKIVSNTFLEKDSK